MYQKVLEKLKNRRLLVVLILLFFVVNIFVITTTFSEKTSSSTWDGKIGTKFASGSGTANDPYIIKTGNELSYFFSVINGENSDEYFNKFYKLDNNINLNGYDFSFSTFEKTFSGVFDGNGYSIFNFKLNKYYLSDDGKVANFNLLDSTYSANIKNLNLSDITFDVDESEILGKKDAEVGKTVGEDEYTVGNIENATTDEEKSSETPNTEEPKEDAKKEEETPEEVKPTENNEPTNDDNVVIEPKEDNKENTNEETKEEPKEDDKKEEEGTSEEENKGEEETTEEETTEEENTPEENTDEVVEIVPVERITVSLFKNVEQTKLTSINIYDIKVNYNGSEDNVDSSLFVLQDINNNTIRNIQINGESKINNTSGLIKLYNNANVENIVYSIKGLTLIPNYETDNDTLMEYNIKDGRINFVKNYPVNSVVELLSGSSDFNWKFEDNKFRIINAGADDSTPKLRSVKKALRGAPSSHESGITGGKVYVNDYVSDANYYEGLNYTYSSNGNIPTTSDKNVYNDNNLVYTELHYHGSDIEGNYTGTVSVSETENEFIYYKIYPVNDNGTSSNKNDDYVSIELIDTPFERRPNNKVFNGWITDYDNAVVTLDMDIYKRFIKIPVTYNGDVPNPINANLYAVWANGVITTYSSWTNSMNALDSNGFHTISSSVDIYEDITQYYIQQTVRWNNRYPDGSVNASGQPLTGTCGSFMGCTAYVHATGTYTPGSGTTYYELYNGNMRTHTIQVIGQTYNSEVPVGRSIAGYFRTVNIPRNTSYAGYYNSSGVLQTSGTCNTNGGCSYYQLIPYEDNNGNTEVVVSGDIYYYLTTRDTNVIVMTSSPTSTWEKNQTKPFTVTGLNNGSDYSSSYTWDIRNTYIYCSEDTRIDNVRIRSIAQINNDTGPGAGNNNNPPTGGMYGNYNNVKIGRGLKQYNSTTTNMGSTIAGNNSGTGSNRSNLTKYNLIVESGLYNTGSSSTPASQTSKTLYVEGTVTYGCDYDRVSTATDKNTKLIYRYAVSGSWSGNNYGASETSSVFTTIVKSGSFGTNKYDYAAGVYVGGRSYGTQYSARTLIFEGGYIYNIVGGPSAPSTMKTLNNVFVYMKGGEADIVVGGAGRSETYGNRIIQITGGTVNYAVFGGSNGVTGSGSEGTLDADSYVYIGGNAVIGDETLVRNNAVESTSLVEAGSVFGIGNGRSGQSSIGTVNNSNVVINESCTINNNVYGGGNYGATGQNGTNKTYSTNIVMYGGEVKGSIYGGGNNNGGGSTSNTININITMNDGDVSGSIYGGSRTTGTIYGSTNVNVVDGTVYTDVYGGGEGSGTFVRNNVAVTIGNNTTGPTINGSVYGGSAYGTVNATTTGAAANSNTVNVTVNNGTVLQSVFGGAKGSTQYTPYVKGNITVDINGGTITNVYGGFDQAGKPQGTDTVYIDGGTVTNAFGGGNRTDIDTTNIYLRGGQVTTMYGGSNQLGAVLTTNVYVQGGRVGTVFGGNNEGGSCRDARVTVSGGEVTSAIYGGGNLVNTTTTTVNISNVANTIPNVYGGGNQAGVTTTNVTIPSGNGTVGITNLYGGSNQSGTVTTSNVTVNKGTIGTAYGGNNAGGSTTTTHVTLNSGSITTLFGGGNAAQSGADNVTVTGGITTTIYGGGNVADSTSSLVNISGGTTSTVYGGGNQADITNNTVVNISGGTISTVVYGGGNEGTVGGSTNVTISNVANTIPNVYGGGNRAGVTTSNVTIPAGNGTVGITNLYGGSNQSGTVTTSNVTVNKGTIGTAYGGNNAGGSTTTTHVTLNNGTVTTMYGGGNQAVADETNATVNGGTVSSVFGGGNQAYVNTETNVTINNAASTISQVFGGGNKAGALETNVTIDATNGTVNITNLFGGSNESGNVDDSHVVIVDGHADSLYGGNNAGGKTLTTGVDIQGGSVSNVFGGGNNAISDSTVVTMSGGTVGNLYAGGNAAGVNLGTSLTMTGGTVTTNVYGGGNEGTVGTNTNVIINDATIGGSAYAGGNGSTATVTGNTSISVGGTTVVGSASCTVLSTCSVFGGGNAAVTGTENANNSTASVNIAGATIYGNVYGGANTSKVFGQTNVNIGKDVATTAILERGDVSIHGTVFGGGEANASGSDVYDWTFVSVTQAIVVNINGQDYQNFEILGSIFGSGNASTTTGTSTITLKNYGTYANPQRNVSIQRTDLLVLDNSAVVLEGATDRENEYSDVLFSLSRIDEMNLKNNSTLFLETGANLLKEYKSLTANGSVATVTIDPDNQTVTRNVDNRIYMYVDKKLNIAKDQSITDYGEVLGMTFFGMYKYNSDDSINTGIYDKFDYGDTLDWGDVFDNVSSYVLGLHKTNHDIEADGFYTNYIDEATSKNIPNYIEPTPPTGPLYMWTIGEAVIEYEIDLVASKYTTLGTIELSLRDFTDPNTSFEILGFDYSEVAQGIQLIDKNLINKIAPTDQEANTVMGLSMQTSNIGWLTNGYTQFMTNPQDPVVGTKKLVGGNSAAAPTLLFYLHHSKNITEEADMGTARIQLMSIRQISALEKETKRLIITVNMSKVLYNTVDYEGAMTAGRKYELFTSSATNITSSSAISAYFSLFNAGGSIYRQGYHRTLTSNYVLPLNTKITMIDLAQTTPDYYYHIVTQADVTRATQELSTNQIIKYDLSMFEKMGAFNSGKYYDDVQKNIDYCSSGTYCNEEYIFIIDFGDTTINSDALGNQLLLEIRDEDEEIIYSVLAPQHQSMVYNIYTNKDAIIDMDGTIDRNKIYNGETLIADLTIDYTQSMVGSTTIYDTHYFDSKLGIKISLINEDNEVVTGTTLLGLYYEIDEVRYYPNIDGTARIKVADKVDSAEKWVIVNTGTSKIASGHYTLRFESFGSPDGIYYGLNSSDTKDFSIEIVNEIYGLDVRTSPEEMVINADTGLNGFDTSNITYNIDYNSGLTNPSIHLKMYRRNYDTMEDTNYTLVDAQDYFDNALVRDKEKEYIIISNPNEANSVTLRTKEELLTGTYRMQFILYDGSSAIGTVEKYIIIK